MYWIFRVHGYIPQERVKIKINVSSHIPITYRFKKNIVKSYLPGKTVSRYFSNKNKINKVTVTREANVNEFNLELL